MATTTAEQVVSSAKRQRLSAEEAMLFPYPDIPPECIHPRRPHIGDLRRVEVTTSSAWGSTAATRACLETEVTLENEQLIRTHHPTLRDAELVFVAQEHDGRSIWIVAPSSVGDSATTHAGGREIHVMPVGFTDTGPSPSCQMDRNPDALNPRRFLTQRDLNILREMFPLAVGARVFISGWIVILFENLSDIQESWRRDRPAESFGSLRVLYDILDDEPSTSVVSRGSAVVDKPTSNSVASIGLKIRFPDGTEAITVPTHAFIKFRTLDNPLIRRMVHLYDKVKEQLSRFKPIKKSFSLPYLISTRQKPSSNSSMGRRVFLAGQSQSIGTITKTYDPVSSAMQMMIFPITFRHDLSLVTGSDSCPLPQVAVPVGTPQVAGWGNYEDALDGHPLFLMRLHEASGRLTIRSGQAVSEGTRQAIVEATQYTWSTRYLTQNVSILWRTHHDGDSLRGFSGSALCLGREYDRTCLALCFQNFDTPFYSREVLNNDFVPAPAKDPCRHIFLHGGFLLPMEIKKTEIISDGGRVALNFNTYPSRSSHEANSAGVRRSFSSHRD